ncbi:MAG: exodeoxyribonuclease VII large subunit [Deltaproteobacteria bacterium]|nr:exodeoxyribonuclease VII large subunit [Deltaproteobacteria bacterium]
MGDPAGRAPPRSPGLFDSDGSGLSPREVLSVSEVNQRVRLLLERSYGKVTVSGEIGNAKVVSGHHYFSLKDEAAQLPAVLFKREAVLLKFALKDGMQVVATGRLTLYAPYGRYQIVVERLEPEGAGALQVAFEQLKRQLAGEGLFAEQRKRPLPLVPRRVAVVTSPTGAVIRDIVQVAGRRFPNAQILVVPTRVQGAESAPAIAAAIRHTSDLAPALGLDVMIVARGGGSMEDLWGFNDERVARAIGAASIPVVSAVGHETDYTIADFVADRRAPTPSAAAEIVFPRYDELVALLDRHRARAERALLRDLEHWRLRLQGALRAIGDGRALLGAKTQRLSFATLAIERAAHKQLARRRLRLAALGTTLAHRHPRVRLRQMHAGLAHAETRIRLFAGQQLTRRRDRLHALGERLQALSPLGVLERGYGIVIGPDGVAVRDAAAVQRGDRLQIRVARGKLGAIIERRESADGAPLDADVRRS